MMNKGLVEQDLSLQESLQCEESILPEEKRIRLDDQVDSMFFYFIIEL